MIGHIRSILDKDFENLDNEEQRIWKLFGENRDRSRLQRAIENVRFQLGQKDRFLQGIERSGRYLAKIKEIFSYYRLPLELTYLPNVESSFNYQAYSKFGAAGIWQFTRSTGALYLRINSAVDERLDPIQSTAAAARLLQYNYNQIQSWPLGITAYNHGLGGMKRAVRELGTTDIATIIERYQGRGFGFASKNFFAEFLAAKEVFSNRSLYFNTIKMEAPLSYSIFTLPDFVYLATLQRKFNFDTELIKKYNPALRSPVLSGQQRIPRGFDLKLPAETGQLVEREYQAELTNRDRFPVQKTIDVVRVKRGDSLLSIAAQFRTTVKTLKEYNSLPSSKIFVGQRLRIPVSETLPAAEESAKKLALKLEPPGERAPEPKNKSESLAKKAGDNGMVSPRAAKRVLGKGRFAFIQVEPEETIEQIAAWLKVSTAELKELNRFKKRQKMTVGMRLKLDFRNVSQSGFTAKRNEFHAGLEEDFHSNFLIKSIYIYKLQKGDSIWDLCLNKFNIPLWLFYELNDQITTTKISAGMAVNIPVVVRRK